MRKANYDKFPSTKLTGMLVQGWDSIISMLKKKMDARKVLAVDLYTGVYEEEVLDDMRWKAKNILLTDFDVRGHRTLERTLNDRSVPFLINGTDAGEAMRQALLEGKWIYCPQISKSMPDLHFLHAEKTCNRVMAYTKSPVNKTVYQEKNGKIIPYVPALKKVSKTKRNNSLKM